MTEAAPRPQLPATALPAATTGRFVLLLATVVAASAYLYGWLAQRLTVVTDAPRRCAQTARETTAAVSADALTSWYADCMRWASLTAAQVIGWMLLVLVVVTAAVYAAYPWFARRELMRLDDVTGYDAERAAVRTLVDERGGRNVGVWVDLANGVGGTRAFGWPRRRQIAVRLDDLRKPPDQQGWVRHELAHIRSGDVDLTVVAVAIGWGFLAAVVVPFTLVAARAPGELRQLAPRIVLLMALVWLVRASVLRMREYHADAAAAEPGPGDEESLIAALRSQQSQKTNLLVRANHPPAYARIDALRTGRVLFRLDPVVALATGALVGLAYPSAYNLLTLALPDTTYLRGWLCGLVFGTLTATVLAGAVWRAVLWEAVHGERARVWPSAAAFAVGVLAGEVLTPEVPLVGSWGAVAARNPWYGLAVGAALFLGATAVAAWIRLGARTWLPLSGSPRWAYHFGIVQVSLLAAVWLAAWFQLVELSGTGEAWLIGLVFAVSLLNPAVVASLIWVFGYAVVTWQTPRMARRKPEYALPAAPRSSLAAVFVATAAGLAGYALIEPLLYAPLRQAMAEVNGLGGAGVGKTLEIVTMLLAPAAAVATVTALALGFAAGGRGRLGQAVGAAGSTLLLLAGLMFIGALVHLNLASPLAQDVPTLLAGLSGVSLSGPLPADRPEPSLGLMVSAFYLVLLLLGLPAAMAGSALRSIVRRPAPAGFPRRGRFAVAAAVTIAVLAVPLVALTAAEWQTRMTIPLPDAVDKAAINRILDEARPGTLSLPQACGGILAEIGGPELARTTASGHLDTRLATVAKLALSADDATLAALGKSVKTAIQFAEVQAAARGAGVTLQYCAAVDAFGVSAAG